MKYKVLVGNGCSFTQFDEGKSWVDKLGNIGGFFKTFNISEQKSAVIIIFGIATVLFSLVFTAYLYTLPPEQDTMYLLKPNLLWINTVILFFVTYFFGKVTKGMEFIDQIKKGDGPNGSVSNPDKILNISIKK